MKKGTPVQLRNKYDALIQQRKNTIASLTNEINGLTDKEQSKAVMALLNKAVADKLTSKQITSIVRGALPQDPQQAIDNQEASKILTSLVNMPQFTEAEKKTVFDLWDKDSNTIKEAYNRLLERYNTFIAQTRSMIEAKQNQVLRTALQKTLNYAINQGFTQQETISALRNTERAIGI